MARAGTNHKGGRPKGALAKSTLDALAVKSLYVEKAKEHALPILEALVKKALLGDVAAIREFNDRAYGRPSQALTGVEGKDLFPVPIYAGLSTQNTKDNGNGQDIRPKETN